MRERLQQLVPDRQLAAVVVAGLAMTGAGAETGNIIAHFKTQAEQGEIDAQTACLGTEPLRLGLSTVATVPDVCRDMTVYGFGQESTVDGEITYTVPPRDEIKQSRQRLQTIVDGIHYRYTANGMDFGLLAWCVGASLYGIRRHRRDFSE